MEVKVQVSKQRVSDLLCNALEGGSNYWYEIVQKVAPKKFEFYSAPELGGGTKENPKVFPHLDYPMNPDGCLWIRSLMEDNDSPRSLNLTSLERGLQLMAEKYPHHWGDFLAENDDATTGDVFLQLALYGEVIYG